MRGATDNPDFLIDAIHRRRYLRVLRENERQTLSQLYEPNPTTKLDRSAGDLMFPLQLQIYITELQRRKKHFQDTGIAVHASMYVL